ncbi:vesicle coat component [Rhinocladiella similis]
MESANHANDDLTSSQISRSGHWLPALRPEVLEAPLMSPGSDGLPNTVVDLPTGFVDKESHIIPPSSLLADGESKDASGHGFPEMPHVEEHNEPSPGLKTAEAASAVSTPWSTEPVGVHSGGDELPSEDDDERLDPAWGIVRTDTTRILEGVKRSTTFPEFSTPDTPNDSIDRGTSDPVLEPHATIAEIEKTSNSEQENPPTEPQSLEWMKDQHDGPRGSHSWTMTEQSPAVDEATERFEEGIPLIQAEESAAKISNEEETSSSFTYLAVTSTDDEETSFFSQINGTADSAPEAPSLDRKSTTQVLSSLNFSTSDALDSPAMQHEHEAPESSFFQMLADQNATGEHPPGGDSKPAENADVDAAAWAAALSDDEFLVEDADDLLPDSEPGSPSSFEAALRQGASSSVQDNSDVSSTQMTSGPDGGRPQPQRQLSANPYAPHQPSTADMLHISPTARTTHNNIGISRPELGPMNSFQEQLPQRPSIQPMKSFVDQTKDGYKSPYDLPMDISKPRKRAHAPAPVQTSTTVAPPPRSSSLSDKPLQSPFVPSMAPAGPTPQAAPAANMQNRSVSGVSSSRRSERPNSGSSSFFEELPIVAKPRPSSGHGRYTPQHNITASPPQLPPQSPPRATYSPPQARPSPPPRSDPYAQFQLRAPERMDPYSNVALQPPTQPAVSTTRYSPAPPASVASAPRTGPSPRYSPAPPPAGPPANPLNRYASQPMVPPATAQAAPPMPHRYASQPHVHAAAPPPVLPFQPRTSSPLAYHKSSIDESANEFSTSHGQRAGGLLRQVSAAGAIPSQSVTSPETPSSFDASFYGFPAKPHAPERIPPPRRSQTQSPSKQRPQATFPAHISDVPNRPASAYGQPVVDRATLESIPPVRPQAQARGLTSDLEFVRPIDEAQFDPLERWKGAPVFKFGFGGSVVSTFPKHVPRYTAGSARPQIKSAPGKVSTRNLKDVIVPLDALDNFPGPLRVKSKKKDVLSWMSDYIGALESSGPNVTISQSVPDPGRRHHEKLLLWKVVRALVEHDGILDGTALKSVNLILSPEVHALDEQTATQYRTDSEISGIYRPSGNNARIDSVDPMAVENLRKRLLSGDRQAAVFHAMDSRLWSHALIISSTMERSVWSQVVREFVRQEVKTVGENSESLSALYEIFGGNLEESIDELVPPSARAGLTMVSKIDSTGPTKNALDGLDRWKETLGLVLNNRCQGDQQALVVLGKLLEDYDRIEAAHVCYLFSRSPARPTIFGGSDDDQTPITLLGANHKRQPFDFGRDNEAIVLTEIVEFATSVLAAGATTSFMPHLSAYKLQRAKTLADNGQKAEAQAYCDAIAATLKSTTKMSLYYHPLFLSELDDLSNRLKQTPIQGSSSWLGKPSLEKVSGSVWNKFSSFVAGDDSDADSKGSGKDATEAGPFANVTGTPSMSRTGSQSDLYGAYSQSLPATVSNSRYAPNGLHSTRSSSELTRGRPSLDSQRSPPSTSHSHNRQYEPLSMLQQTGTAQSFNPYQAFAAASPPSSFPQSPPRSSYVPNNRFNSIPEDQPQPSYVPTPPAEEITQQSFGYHKDPVSTQINEAPVGYVGYEPPHPQETATLPQHDQAGEVGYAPPSQSYGYEPPTDSGYVPYVPEPDSPEETKPKKKSFMDDDGGDFPKISSQSQTPASQLSVGGEDEAARKRANDEAAEAAFRAAAEADAAREKEKAQAKRTSSWFGGWLGGKKAEQGLDSSKGGGTEPKIYKAKLGESKMKLYYDKDLGKWVNPDNPDAAIKTATPPPPRMGGTPAPPMSSGGPPMAPSLRHTSTPSLPNMSVGPMSGPGSRSGTPTSGPTMPSPLPGMSGPPSGTGTPPPAPTSTPGLAPPRPSTATSNASSIDDLIGPATGRKGAGKGAKKAKGRYVDVMAK